MKKYFLKFISVTLVLTLGFAVVSTWAAEAGDIKAGEKKAPKETKQTEQTKRHGRQPGTVLK